MSRTTPIIAIALLCLLAAACSNDSPDAPFATYIARLARTLEVEAPPHTASAPIPHPPRSGQMQIDPPEQDRLGGLDFLDLQGCELQVTIGKRNSSLGRMARPSQRLLLELEFLRLAPACIGQLRGGGNKTLADTLQAAWAQKRAELPARIFNATLGGEEYRGMWRASTLTGEYPANTGSGVPDALAAVDALAARWLDGDYRADNEHFELLLGEIARGDAGQLWQALAQQADWLGTADAILAERATRGPLCAEHYRPAAADILPNVVRLYFIDGIQPRAAALGARFHSLLPPVQALEKRLQAVLPDNYRQWRDTREAQLEQLAAAPKTHVHALQALLEPCQAPAATAR